MSLFQMKAPIAFAQANSVQGLTRQYAINGGVTNIQGPDLLYFLSLGFTPLDEVLASYSDFLNKTKIRLVTASMTLGAENLAELLVFDSASPLTLTLPTHANLPLVAGATINLCSVNTGAVTLSAAAGVTMIYASGLTGVLSGAGKLASIIKVDESRWVGAGGL
jgi:hypothetical protein